MNAPPNHTRTERLLLAGFTRMVGAFPADFAQEYSSDIVALLADQLRGRRPLAQLRVFLAATTDLAVAIPREYSIVARALQPLPAVAVVHGPPPVRIGRPLPNRRRFLRTAMVLTAGAMGSGFASAGVAYLWPRTGAGFGSLVDVGRVEEARTAVVSGGGTHPLPSARAYLVAYDPRDDPEGDYAALTGGTGMMALYQKCVHLGCRVPWCGASSWFECPCHGSQYNRWGEYQAGPAPRGLDRFHLLIQDGNLVVDTRLVVTGPARAVDTLGEPPRGPHCGSVDR